MKKENFVKEIELMKAFNDKVDLLSDNLNINIIESDFYSIPAQLFDNFIESVCTEDGAELVFWWMYEDVEKVIYESDESSEKVEYHLDTVDDLFNYMCQNNYFQ
jgi:hypothetical protein